METSRSNYIQVTTIVDCKTGDVVFVTTCPLDAVHNDLPRPFEETGRMRVKEAVKRYNISSVTLYAYIRDGRLPRYEVNGIMYVYEDDMENALKTKGTWIARNR